MVGPPCEQALWSAPDSLFAGYGWPVKKAIVDLSIRLKGNSKRTSGNSSSPSGGGSEQGSWLCEAGYPRSHASFFPSTLACFRDFPTTCELERGVILRKLNVL